MTIKNIINFFRDRFTRGHVVALVLLALCAMALLAINAYVLHITRGHYNAIDFLLM